MPLQHLMDANASYTVVFFPLQYTHHAKWIMVDAVIFASWPLSLRITAVLVLLASTYSQMAGLAHQVGILQLIEACILLL